MKGTKTRTVNTLGMFDLFKGIGMATVILAHTTESYSLSLEGGISAFGFLLFIYREALMSAFYIASGYGFRKRSVGKCIQQQLKGILPPFLYTALATAGLHLFLHHHFFGSWPSAVAESEKVLAGFLLGLPHTSEYFGVSIFSCGPMWYLLTMAVGWVLLDLLYNAFPERYIPCAVVVTAALGWGTCLGWELPFCLSQGMTVVPYLYLGHVAKKRRWFEQPRPRWIFPAGAVLLFDMHSYGERNLFVFHLVTVFAVLVPIQEDFVGASFYIGGDLAACVQKVSDPGRAALFNVPNMHVVYYHFYGVRVVWVGRFRNELHAVRVKLILIDSFVFHPGVDNFPPCHGKIGIFIR